MSDVREAAERVKEFGEQADFGIVHEAGVVARAYLAEHSADDGESVTEEWLRSVGFTKDDDAPFTDFAFVRGGLKIEEYASCEGREGGWCAECGRLCRVPTRGHVRRLCSALGIQLKESP